MSRRFFVGSGIALLRLRSCAFQLASTNCHLEGSLDVRRRARGSASTRAAEVLRQNVADQRH
jgi:hypothetical protein